MANCKQIGMYFLWYISIKFFCAWKSLLQHIYCFETKLHYLPLLPQLLQLVAYPSQRHAVSTSQLLHVLQFPKEILNKLSSSERTLIFTIHRHLKHPFFAFHSTHIVTHSFVHQAPVSVQTAIFWLETRYSLI